MQEITKEKPMKYYITKYALSFGVYILEVENDEDELDENKLIEENYGYHKVGEDAFSTLEEAIKQVQLLKDRKLKSLEEQMIKISDLNPETIVTQATIKENNQ